MLVETQSLAKHYGTFAALDDCSLTLGAGEIFGLLGPNGAGKTTLIRLLLGFLRPTHGVAHIAGFDCFRQSVAVRERVSYLPAEAKLFRRMKADEVLRFFAQVRGSTGNAERAIRLAGRLDLDVQRRVAFMSTGMRQKLALAATLSHDTPLMILDEPTANLDPNVRREVMQIVGELRGEGRTVLLSSHVLSEIEEVCDRVVILRNGHVVHTQNMTDLRQKHRVRGRCESQTPKVPSQFANRVSIQTDHGHVTIETEGDLGELLPWIAELPLSRITIEPYGLRSVYDRYHADGDAA